MTPIIVALAIVGALGLLVAAVLYFVNPEDVLRP